VSYTPQASAQAPAAPALGNLLIFSRFIAQRLMRDGKMTLPLVISVLSVAALLSLFVMDD
jgi:hypothetical protein